MLYCGDMKKWQPVDSVFVGIALPDELKAHIAMWQMRLAEIEDSVVWETGDNLHITLAFVGKISAGERSAIIEGMRELEAKELPVQLSLGHIDYFYNRHSDGVLWMAVYDQENVLVDLHKQLVKFLNEREFSLSERKIIPHVTIGKLKQKGIEKKQSLAALADVEVDEYPKFEVDSLQLFKSQYEKSDDRNIYTILKTVSLEWDGF